MQTPSGPLAHSAMISPVAQAPAGSGGKKKLIYDQDHRGPLSTDTVATLMLLQADNIDLLGICTVTGHMWAKQETAYALACSSSWVVPKCRCRWALKSLWSTPRPRRKYATRRLARGHSENEGYLGCFAKDSGGRDELEPLSPPYSRFGQITAQPEPAADFIISTIRANPNEVTVY